jgi:hypothetical protein
MIEDRSNVPHMLDRGAGIGERAGITIHPV